MLWTCNRNVSRDYTKIIIIKLKLATHGKNKNHYKIDISEYTEFFLKKQRSPVFSPVRSCLFMASGERSEKHVLVKKYRCNYNA